MSANPTKNQLNSLLRQLPMISRIDSRMLIVSIACVALFLTGAFTASLVDNFLLKDSLRLVSIQLVQNPNQPQPHYRLAEEYLKANQTAQAETELQLAKALAKNQPQLHQQIVSKLSTIETANTINQKIDKWKEIVGQKPQYRDGWLQLALLYWQIYQEDRARWSLEQALTIDPNFGPSYQLEQTLGIKTP